MSNIEIAILVISCLIPVIALIIILPKLKKKKSATAPKTDEKPKEVQPSAPILEKKDKPTLEKTSEQNQDELNDEVAYTSDDFKSYLQEKKQKITRPKRKDELPEFDFEDYDRFKLHQNRSDKTTSKSIADEINDLSPEIKAMIIAGVLDKKDYNDY